MLRNSRRRWRVVPRLSILNEVLSLNAQECIYSGPSIDNPTFLNEVLSLNAQECPRPDRDSVRPSILNEVLSLNAQE